MANTNYQSIDEYIAAQPERNQAALHRVRHAIAKALPKAEEAISYQIPAFKLEKRAVIYFAGWTNHYAVYPASKQMLDAFETELADHEVRKHTIRFAFHQPVPAKLIGKLAQYRAQEVKEHFEAKAAARSAARAALPVAPRRKPRVNRALSS